MTNHHHPSDSDDAESIAAFERARAEAEDSGIAQDGLRDPAAFLAAVAPMSSPIAFDIASLQAAGFFAHIYPGQEGTFYRRLTRAETMPLLSRHIDDYYVFVDSVAVTELTPTGQVQVSLLDGGDYSDGPFDPASEEGQGLLRDSIAGDCVDVEE
jgi:hypothetical protein